MTEEIFRRDAYMFEFESTVISVDGDIVELESSAFYPGGGGQVCDTGNIRGERVTEAFYKGDSIVHRVPGTKLKVGDRVWCGVDWERRYDLMKGHTGEHLLFCSLKRQDPELEITKIFISPESKYVIVNHDMDWNGIRAATAFANAAIRDALPVSKSFMDRDDPDLADVRIKMDRIGEDEEISVVSIGDIDLSACTGVHVMETSELECIFVTRKVSAGKDGVAIHFEVGGKAVDAAMDLAYTCLEASDAASSKADLLVRTITNMKHDLETANAMMREASGRQLAALEPYTVGDLKVYSGRFAADRKTLTERAEAIKSSGGVAAFVSVSDTVSVLLASGDPRVDCRKILPEVLKEFDGRGGGKTDFAQGGIEDVDKADRLLESLKDAVSRAIKLN